MLEGVVASFVATGVCAYTTSTMVSHSALLAMDSVPSSLKHG
jgi:hypothetical protein